MAHSNKQTELTTTEEETCEMRRSFSWNRAFFTNDGFLDAEELSSMIEGGDDDVNHQLEKIEEIESLEAKLFQEIEASTRTSNVSRSSIEVSSGKKDSQAKLEKVAFTASPSSSTPVTTPPSGGSRGKKVKSPVRRSASFKSGIGEGDSPSKTSAGIKKRNNVVPVSTRVSRTAPASPGSAGSSSSTYSVNQRSKRSSSVPRRASVNSDKPSAINARRNDEQKTTKNKVGPVSTRMSRTPPASPGSSGSSSSTLTVTQRSKRSNSVPRRSLMNSEKPSAINARRDDERKTTKNKVEAVSTRMSRTPPASPGSSSSTSVKQRPKRSSSVPRRSSVNNEKPSATNARRNDEWKINKPEVRLIPKTQSGISLKIKPPPVVSHPSSPTELYNSSSSSRAQRSSSSSSTSSTCKVNKRSKPVGRSKSASKHRPTGQIPDQNGKQSVASRPETRSASASKTRKFLAPKAAAAVDPGLKSISLKTATPKSSRKQSSAKAKSSSSISRGAENIILVSPEVMDIKGKLNALKMEISMQKKDRCKETK